MTLTFDDREAALKVIYLRGNSNLDSRGMYSALYELSPAERQRARWRANGRTVENLARQFGVPVGYGERHMFGLPLITDTRVPNKFVWLEVEEAGININQTITIGNSRLFRPGDPAKLIDELGGLPVTVVGHYSGDQWQVRLAGGKQFTISAHALQKFVPKWMPGDVVVVRFGGAFSTPYTYVRGVTTWPGETTSKSDAQIDRLFLEGKAKPVLQQGGKAFDIHRLRPVA